MRPLRLTLDAFGSYAGRFSVDFARLGRHGIFAITGPTGAGKSTIFDALVYALYDDLPGFRVDGNVRSQYADASTETRVCLEFEVHGEVWSIERRPAQEGARRRGSGAPVGKPSTVVLRRVGSEGGGITRKHAVAAKVEELVGLTKAQFEQVVLIPQGRFEEVLKADTAGRAPLLRRLFPVDVFAEVTEQLRAVAAERQRSFEGAERRHEDLVERLRDSLVTAATQVPDACLGAGGGPWPVADELERGVFGPEDLAHHLDELTRVCALVDELVKEAGEAADGARANRDAAREAALRWEEWQRDLEAASGFEHQERADAAEAVVLERARRLLDLREALECWRSEGERLDELCARIAHVREAMELGWLPSYGAEPPADAAAAELLAHRMAADADALAGEQARYERLVERSEELDAAEGQLGVTSCELARAAEALEERRGALAAMRVEVGRVSAFAAALPAARARVDELQRELADAERRSRAELALHELAAARSAAEYEVEGARAALEAARGSWQAGAAGRLAELLVEGVPCPTCGSSEHPHPATLQAGAADDQALTAAGLALEEALARRDDAALREAAARGELGALVVSRSIEEIDHELGACSAELDDMAAAVQRLEELEPAARLLEDDVKAAASDAERRDKELAERRVRIEIERRGWAEARDAYAAEHGDFAPVGWSAQTLRTLSAQSSRLGQALRQAEAAAGARTRLRAVLGAVMDAFEVDSPAQLAAWALPADEVARRTADLDARLAARDEVRRRIADYERDGPSGCPDLLPLEVAFEGARAAHLDLVARQAIMGKQAAYLLTGPDLVAESSEEIAAARRACEEARTVADLCAGLGSGAASTRLSLENWVLSYYLRQVLAQANARLATMTDGRYSLRLSEGSTDGRKQWGLDISVFDVNTGHVRPATTLSGGETFMAALSLALGLADVVSCGSNRDVGALFVDEGFGSLDAESLDAVIDVLRSLEDGGRVVGVISHVHEVTRALTAGNIGISVATSLRGSVAEVHYPDH